MDDNVDRMMMEDDDARQRAEQPENDQGASKRRPSRETGVSLPEESAGPGQVPAGEGTTTGGGGASQGGGSSGEGGGASQGGGSGN